jgi:4-amino-4-deoxychorismate lyase
VIFKHIIIPQNGLYKLRLLYNDTQYNIEINEYKQKIINKLHIIEDSTIDYTYKYADRSIFDKYTSKLNQNEDIIIIKNGHITDSSYSNLIFWDGKNWITPSTPLLFGTKRQKLIDSNIIEIDDIKLTDIKHFKYCKLINAMLDIEDSMQIKL